jgi:hypothetical protein
MDLRARAQELKTSVKAQMGQLVTVQKSLGEKAAAELELRDQAIVDSQKWPPPPPLHIFNPMMAQPQQRFVQPHSQARPAATLRQKAPMLHRMATPPAASATANIPSSTAAPTSGDGSQPPASAATAVAASAAATAATMANNPYAFTASHYRQPAPAQQQPFQQAYHFQQQQQPQFPGAAYGQGKGFGFQPCGMSPFSGAWQQQKQGNGGRKLTWLPEMQMPTQPYEVQAAYLWASNCWPEMQRRRLAVSKRNVAHGEEEGEGTSF